MIEIKMAVNGWILVDKTDTDLPDQVRVFSYTDERTEAEAFRDLLYTLKDLVGPSESRYSQYRLYTIIRPGDKNDSFTEDDANAIWGKTTHD